MVQLFVEVTLLMHVARKPRTLFMTWQKDGQAFPCRRG
jgi:hypothetical protein